MKDRFPARSRVPSRAPARLVALLLAVMLALLASTSVGLSAPAGLRAGYQAIENTRLVSGDVSGTARLPLNNGMARLSEPLVVFYEAGAQPVAAPGETVGALISGRYATTISVVDCPTPAAAQPVAAVCLAPGPLAGVGTYKGSADLIPTPDGEADAEDAQPVAGSVDVSLIVQRPWWLFALTALAGILLSLFANWYVTEYQAARRLRAKIDTYWNGETGACREPVLREKAAGETTVRLALTDPCQAFSQAEIEKLQRSGARLWLATFLPDARPDYDALNEAVDKTAKRHADLDALCEVTAALVADNEQVDERYAALGATEPPALALLLQAETEPARQQETVGAGAIRSKLEKRQALHELAGRWHDMAGHVVTLSTRYKQLTGRTIGQPSAGGSGLEFVDPAELEDMPGAAAPGKREIAVVDRPAAAEAVAGEDGEANGAAETPAAQARLHIATARSKLGAIANEAGFQTLQPERDIQAAWLALEKVRRDVELGLEGEKGTAELAEAMPEAEALPDWRSLARRAIAAWRGWAPALNRAAILALLLISLAATLLLGTTLLYAGKPWGTVTDFLVLLVLGGGVHAGLTGIAGTIMGSKAGR